VDQVEARGILWAHLDEWRRRTYAELKSEVGESRQLQTTAQSGTQYQVDVQVPWDDIPNGDIRVLGGIDDGGWHAFAPLAEDFILGPDGKFVGEERQQPPATTSEA
jgi:hypothetical protein